MNFLKLHLETIKIVKSQFLVNAQFPIFSSYIFRLKMASWFSEFVGYASTTSWDIGFFICSRCNFKRLTLYLRQSRVYQKANFDADGDNQDRYSYSENWSNRKLISDVIEENKFLELSKKRVWTFRNASSTFRVGKSIGLLEFFRLWKSLFRVD